VFFRTVQLLLGANEKGIFKMGYKRNISYLLKFEDDEYAGLEVEMRSINVKTALELQSQLKDVDDGNEESLKGGMRIFADHLIRWNLEDDRDNPIPPTLDSVYDLDLKFVVDLLASWMEVAAGVSSDLGKASTSTETSAEGSIPMETL
jgi:hypothetical protein